MTQKKTEKVKKAIFLRKLHFFTNFFLIFDILKNKNTAQNFISAGLKYFTHVQELGIKRYVTDYDGDIYDSAFKTWNYMMARQKLDSRIAVGRKASGDSRAYVTLGEIPLSEIM